MNSGRLVGLLLIGAGVVLALVGALWLFTNVQEGTLRASGAVFGAGCGAPVVLLLVGGGVFLLVRSGREAVEEAERRALRRILDIVESRGQVPISDLALELGLTRDQVHEKVHALVGMGLFSGYINWEDGVLYSEEASSLQALERCKRCGGELKLAGKGVITCPYCGTEYFLS